nr:MAG TPA: hypothetical protein [Caudoviricetes sp.]
MRLSIRIVFSIIFLLINKIFLAADYLIETSQQFTRFAV